MAKKELNFDFFGHRKLYFIISSVLIVLSIVLTLTMGVKIDIKFTGGTIATYSYTGSVDASAFQKVAEQQTGIAAKLQQSTNIATGKTNFVLNFSQTEGLPVEEQNALTDALEKAFPDNEISLVSTNSVSPTMGKDFLLKCLITVGICALFMTIYIALRFKRISGWSSGVMAVIALIHDMLMVYAAFVIFRLSLDDNFIAVLLVILGYSVNDTIIIYDRIRENKKLYNTMEPEALVNLSVNQTLPRTINTTISTLIAMVSICALALIFQVNSIISFALPLIVGLISGAYSSICLSPVLWVLWQNRKRARRH